MDALSDGLDVVIRVHGPADEWSLGRSVFAAALQDHQPVRIIVMCRGVAEAVRDALAHRLAPVMAIEPTAMLMVVDQACPPPPSGRYVTVISSGDVLYPEAGRLLIAELCASGAALAEGGMLLAWTDRDGVVPYVSAKTPAAAPILVLDRSRVDARELAVPDDGLPGRVLARHAASARLRDITVAERPHPGIVNGPYSATVLKSPEETHPCVP